MDLLAIVKTDLRAVHVVKLLPDSSSSGSDELFSFESLSRMFAVAWLPDNRSISVGTETGSVVIWDLESRTSTALEVGSYVSSGVTNNSTSASSVESVVAMQWIALGDYDHHGALPIEYSGLSKFPAVCSLDNREAATFRNAYGAKYGSSVFMGVFLLSSWKAVIAFGTEIASIVDMKLSSTSALPQLGPFSMTQFDVESCFRIGRQCCQEDCRGLRITAATKEGLFRIESPMEPEPQIKSLGKDTGTKEGGACTQESRDQMSCTAIRSVLAKCRKQMSAKQLVELIRVRLSQATADARVVFDLLFGGSRVGAIALVTEFFQYAVTGRDESLSFIQRVLCDSGSARRRPDKVEQDGVGLPQGSSQTSYWNEKSITDAEAVEKKASESVERLRQVLGVEMATLGNQLWLILSDMERSRMDAHGDEANTLKESSHIESSSTEHSSSTESSNFLKMFKNGFHEMGFAMVELTRFLNGLFAVRADKRVSVAVVSDAVATAMEILQQTEANGGEESGRVCFPILQEFLSHAADALLWAEQELDKGYPRPRFSKLDVSGWLPAPPGHVLEFSQGNVAVFRSVSGESLSVCPFQFSLHGKKSGFVSQGNGNSENVPPTVLDACFHISCPFGGKWVTAEPGFDCSCFSLCALAEYKQSISLVHIRIPRIDLMSLGTKLKSIPAPFDLAERSSISERQESTLPDSRLGFAGSSVGLPTLCDLHYELSHSDFGPDGPFPNMAEAHVLHSTNLENETSRNSLTGDKSGAGSETADLLTCSLPRGLVGVWLNKHQVLYGLVNSR